MYMPVPFIERAHIRLLVGPNRGVEYPPCAHRSSIYNGAVGSSVTLAPGYGGFVKGSRGECLAKDRNSAAPPPPGSIQPYSLFTHGRYMDFLDSPMAGLSSTSPFSQNESLNNGE